MYVSLVLEGLLWLLFIQILTSIFLIEHLVQVFLELKHIKGVVCRTWSDAGVPLLHITSSEESAPLPKPNGIFSNSWKLSCAFCRSRVKETSRKRSFRRAPCSRNISRVARRRTTKRASIPISAASCALGSRDSCGDPS